jgi:hypothetical protein
MLLIDRALNASRLIWALKVSLNGSAFLLEIEVFRRCGAVWVIAIQRPLSANVRRRHDRRSLLWPGSQLKDNWKEQQTDKTTDSLFHFYFHFTFLTDKPQRLLAIRDSHRRCFDQQYGSIVTKMPLPTYRGHYTPSMWFHTASRLINGIKRSVESGQSARRG